MSKIDGRLASFQGGLGLNANAPDVSLNPTLLGNAGLVVAVSAANPQTFAPAVVANVLFDSVILSSPALSYNPATGVATCNTAGTYLVSCTFNAIGPLNGSARFSFLHNGVERTFSFIRQPSNVSQTYVITSVVVLAVGETCGFTFESNGASGVISATDAVAPASTIASILRIA